MSRLVRIVFLVLFAGGVAALILLLTARARPPAAPPSMPGSASTARLSFEPPTIALGTVPAGESRPIRVRVTNDGDRPIAIAAVDGGCGCLQFDWPRHLDPGQSGQVTGTFSPPTSWAGPIEKHIAFHVGEGGEQPEVVLKADIDPMIRTEPTNPVQLPLPLGKPLVAEVRLTPRPGVALTLSNPTADDPTARLELIPPAGTGRTYRLKLRAGPWPGAGDHSIQVQVACSHPGLGEVRLHVSGLAESGPVLSPERLYLPIFRKEQVGREIGTVVLFTRRGRVDLKRIECTLPGVRTEKLSADAPNFHPIKLTYTGGWAPGSLKGQLTLHLADRRFPRLSVPISIIVN